MLVVALTPEPAQPNGAAWARELRHVLGRAVRLHREREAVSPETFSRRRVRIERATDRLISGLPLGGGVARTLQRCHRRHRASLFVCLHRADVPPINNCGRQDRRPSAVYHKVTGGHRSDWGADASAVLTSLLTVARLRSENLLDAAGPSPLRAARIPA